MFAVCVASAMASAENSILSGIVRIRSDRLPITFTSSNWPASMPSLLRHIHTLVTPLGFIFMSSTLISVFIPSLTAVIVPSTNPCTSMSFSILRSICGLYKSTTTLPSVRKSGTPVTSTLPRLSRSIVGLNRPVALFSSMSPSCKLAIMLPVPPPLMFVLFIVTLRSVFTVASSTMLLLPSIRMLPSEVSVALKFSPSMAILAFNTRSTGTLVKTRREP